MIKDKIKEALKTGRPLKTGYGNKVEITHADEVGDKPVVGRMYGLDHSEQMIGRWTWNGVWHVRGEDSFYDIVGWWDKGFPMEEYD